MAIKEIFVDSFKNELEFYRNAEGDLYITIRTEHDEKCTHNFIVLKRKEVNRIIENLSKLEPRINDEDTPNQL